MIKKNKKVKVLLILAIAILLLIIILSGSSLSKYITQVEGKGIIQVANWAFIVNGQTSSITNINLSNTFNKETLIDNRIAPGTSGSFDIVIDASGSDVGIDYDVKFQNETGKPSNLVFIYENHIVQTIKDLEEYLTGRINANDEEKVRTLTINWEWNYETGTNEEQININDNKDTEDGINLKSLSFDVIITGIQVEPIT